MLFIKLTENSTKREKFVARIDLIEYIIPLDGYRSCLYMASGEGIECIESVETVHALIKEIVKKG